MGPLGKVLTGYTVSLALLLGGLWLERKNTYRIIARAGIGGGWALGFFTTFAMHHLNAAHVINSLALDLVLMLIVAGGMVAHSLRYKSQTVTSLAFLLAFATLLTSHLESQLVFSLSASAVLAIALVTITIRMHWARLELAGLIAVYLTHFFWLTRVIPNGNPHAFTAFWPSTALILLYWLIFRVAYLVDSKEVPERHLSAVLNAIGVLGLLKFQSVHPEWAWWALALLGVIEFSLAWGLRSRRRTAFVILSTIGILLLIASVPFKFHGVSWPILWLVEAHVLAISGLRLGEPLFRRLGLLTGLATGLVLALFQVFPLIFFRLDSPDPSRHLQLTTALALAALLYWVHAELYPRRWPVITEASKLGEFLGLAAWEHIALPITSFLALGAAASALWVVLPDKWVCVGWIVLALLIGKIADWLNSVQLSIESDLAAIIACAAVFLWNLSFSAGYEHTIPIAITIALFYLCMFRKTSIEIWKPIMPAAYSWVAAFLVAALTIVFMDSRFGYEIASRWTVTLCLALGLIFFEVGCFFKRRDFLWQGYVYAATTIVVSFATIFTDFGGQQPAMLITSATELLSRLNFPQLVLSALILYWIAERTLRSTSLKQRDRVAGWILDTLANFVLMIWPVTAASSIWVHNSPYLNAWMWIAPLWALMALILLALTSLFKRPLLQYMAILLAIAAVLRTWSIDLLFAPPAGWINSVLFRSALTAALLMLALPFAYQLRRLVRKTQGTPAYYPFLAVPEQWFFFTAFALEVVVLAVRLNSAHVTIAWAILGVAVFLFALLVSERSFRLSGLALLLLSVLKILLMDVWQLQPSDRYTTLIILGLALLGVSFLYTRFSAVIRKFL